MPLAYTPTTELEAVNQILGGIGEMPVNTLPTTGVSEATLALNKLHAVNRRVQGMCLHCNSEEDYPVAAEADGTVSVASNVLAFDPTDAGKDYVLRGVRVYDRVNHTYTIGETVKANITFFLPFEELPHHVREYITIVAVREFQRDTVGAPDMHKLTEADEYKALALLKKRELSNRDATLLNTFSAANILRGRRTRIR